MLRRLAADGAWVLKGGYLLEARLGDRARATRDLDLTTLVEMAGDELRDAVADALAWDVDADGFVFRLTGARAHLQRVDRRRRAPLDLGGSAGRPFASVRVDVVARPGEVAGGTERVTLVPVLDVDGWPAVEVPAVDLAQHAAEKLHALSAIDAHPRPSTRVKDLVDVILLLDAGMLDEASTSARLRAVFESRDGAPPPSVLPAPPAAWRGDYIALVGHLEPRLPEFDEALASVRALYSRLIAP